MNSSKQMFAIVAVLAMLGAALVGVGYAFTAQTENTDNTSLGDYFLVAANTKTGATGASASYADKFEEPVAYDTELAPSATEGKYDITYKLNPEVIGAEGSSFEDIGLTQLGQFPVNITKPGESTAGSPAASTETYIIQVSFPTSAVLATTSGGVGIENVKFYAKAEATTWSTSDDSETTSGFAADDENVYRMAIHDGIVEGYLPVTSETAGGHNWTVFIAVASETAEFTVTGTTLPAAAIKVLSDANVTVKVDSESIYTTESDSSIHYKAAQVLLNKTSIAKPTSEAATINASAAFLKFGGVDPAAASLAAAGKYIWSVDPTTGVSISEAGVITVTTSAEVGTVTVTCSMYDSDWTTGAAASATASATFTITAA